MAAVDDEVAGLTRLACKQQGQQLREQFELLHLDSLLHSLLQLDGVRAAEMGEDIHHRDQFRDL